MLLRGVPETPQASIQKRSLDDRMARETHALEKENTRDLVSRMKGGHAGPDATAGNRRLPGRPKAPAETPRTSNKLPTKVREQQPDALYHRGVILFHAGQLSEANVQPQKVLEKVIDPGNQKEIPGRFSPFKASP